MMAKAKGNVYSDYAMIPFNMHPVIIRTNNTCRVVEDYEDLKEWWDNEE